MTKQKPLIKVTINLSSLSEHIQNEIFKLSKRLTMIFIEYHEAEQMNLSDPGYYASPRLAEAKQVIETATKPDKDNHRVIKYIHAPGGCSYSDIIGYAVFLKDKSTDKVIRDVNELSLSQIALIKKNRPRFFKFLAFYPAPTDYWRHEFFGSYYEEAPDGCYLKRVYLGDEIGDAIYVAKKEDTDDWIYQP